MTKLSLVLVVVAAGCTASGAEDGVAEQAVDTGGAHIVINEFMPGTSGKIELYNAGDAPASLAGWQVDDIAGGYAPKSVGTVTLAPGAYLSIGYAGVNTASTDEVRVLDAAGAVIDTHSNFYAGSSLLGLCFGRLPDGGAWSTHAITCSPGATNGCAASGACDDGNACTTGETIQPGTCACGGGTVTSCDDGNASTADSCDATLGCAHTPISCDDTNACTTDATDAVLGCTHAAVSCDDGDPSTADSCDVTAGCQHAAIGAPDHAELLAMPRRDKVLLQGTVVLPDSFFQGEVLIEGDTITCVAPSCAAIAQVIDAAVVRTNGLILPGLVDTHNHILFDIFDETHWSPIKAYNNHNQWTAEARYKALVDTKQYLNGEGSNADFGCEMDKYGELKALIAGTTSVQGSANPGDRACYRSLARTIDQSPNGLPFDRMQTASLFPSNSAANSVCANFATNKTDAYVIHVGEGVDATARNELAKLATISSTPECLLAPKTTVIHGTAFGDAELTIMANHGMNLVWSPRSNVFLYGAGTDLTKTANIPLALSKGINVALAPDWSIGGSQNMLDELRFADHVDNTVWGNQLSPQLLFKMATINAARALGLQAYLGSLEVGKKADVMVIAGDAADPYVSLLRATPRDVRLVMVGGATLYGDASVSALGAPAPGCEALDICGGAKFACVAQAGGTAANKLGQSFSDIRSSLDAGLAAYDALDLSPFNFSPITPLVKCSAAGY